MKIGSLKKSYVECEDYTKNFLQELYAFDEGVVLFKPTKCETEQFRPSKSKALSYFIAGENCECPEDGGFAISPWNRVTFENHNLILEEERAIAMGNYFFTPPGEEEVKVEYTFGYKVINRDLKMYVHHSSIPYKH